MSCGSDYLERVVVADATKKGTLQVRGFGVEIVDGGARGPSNLIYFERAEKGLDPSFPDDNFMRAIPGTRRAAAFDKLTLVAPVAGERVRVRVLTRQASSWADADPTGKPRFLFLSRGSQSVDPGVTVKLWASADAGEYDRYVTEERHDVRLFFHGWIGGGRIFDVYIFARRDPLLSEASAPWTCIYKLPSVNNFGIPPSIPGGLPHATFYTSIFDFCRAAVPLQLPPGSAEVYVRNTDADVGTIDWIFGVRG